MFREKQVEYLALHVGRGGFVFVGNDSECFEEMRRRFEVCLVQGGALLAQALQQGVLFLLECSSHIASLLRLKHALDESLANALHLRLDAHEPHIGCLPLLLVLLQNHRAHIRHGRFVFLEERWLDLVAAQCVHDQILKVALPNGCKTAIRVGTTEVGVPCPIPPSGRLWIESLAASAIEQARIDLFAVAALVHGAAFALALRSCKERFGDDRLVLSLFAKGRAALPIRLAPVDPASVELVAQNAFDHALSEFPATGAPNALLIQELRNGSEGMLPFAIGRFRTRVVQIVDVPHMLGVVVGIFQIRIGVALGTRLLIGLAAFSITEVTHAGVIALRHTMLHLRPYFHRQIFGIPNGDHTEHAELHPPLGGTRIELALHDPNILAVEEAFQECEVRHIATAPIHFVEDHAVNAWLAEMIGHSLEDFAIHLPKRTFLFSVDFNEIDTMTNRVIFQKLLLGGDGIFMVFVADSEVANVVLAGRG